VADGRDLLVGRYRPASPQAKGRRGSHVLGDCFPVDARPTRNGPEAITGEPLLDGALQTTRTSTA
jgi:hypothetical protein